MRSIEELMLELVSVQSDTGTAMELAMAEKIYALVKECPYFVEHPEYCGTYEDDDILHRPVVWALRKGTGDRTLVLEGHYDAVEIDTYGTLKPYALSPALLKEKMRSMSMWDEEQNRDLCDDDWCFGRGVADMKAGLAINLHTLFTSRNEEVNIVFVAVPDEENLSSGALQAVGLFEDLKKRYMKAILEKAQIPDPVVVIGVAPPYYLAVNNKYIDKDIGYCLDGLGDYMESRHGVAVHIVPYLSGMCDMSYLSCSSPRAERQFLENLTMPKAVYDVPVERIAALNIPSLLIGPGAKCVHQAGERVFMPDVVERIPDLIGRILERL